MATRVSILHWLEEIIKLCKYEKPLWFGVILLNKIVGHLDMKVSSILVSNLLVKVLAILVSFQITNIYDGVKFSATKRLVKIQYVGKIIKTSF